jgi:hypothetical protein
MRHCVSLRETCRTQSLLLIDPSAFDINGYPVFRKPYIVLWHRGCVKFQHLEIRLAWHIIVPLDNRT